MDPRAGPLHARTHHQTVRRWLHHGADSPADRELSRVPRRAHPRLRVLIRRSDDLRGGSQASGRQGFVPGPDAGSGSPRPGPWHRRPGGPGQRGRWPYRTPRHASVPGSSARPLAIPPAAITGVPAAGGEGAWIGTPLLATHEAIEVSDRYKKCIVESDGQDTVYTEVWDIM